MKIVDFARHLAAFWQSPGMTNDVFDDGVSRVLRALGPLSQQQKMALLARALFAAIVDEQPASAKEPQS